MSRGKGGWRGGSKGGRGGKGDGKAETPSAPASEIEHDAQSAGNSKVDEAAAAVRSMKLSQRFAADERGGSSSLSADQEDQFIALAKQLAELSRRELASHEALARRVADLEAALTASRKELADVRIRNEKLTAQLKSASGASDAQGNRHGSVSAARSMAANK